LLPSTLARQPDLVADPVGVAPLQELAHDAAADVAALERSPLVGLGQARRTELLQRARELNDLLLAQPVLKLRDFDLGHGTHSRTKRRPSVNRRSFLLPLYG